MSRQRLERLGVVVGQPGDPRSYSVNSFEQKGITVADTTVSRIRGLYTSGERLAERLEAREILLSGKVLEKDEFFLTVSQEGLGLRTRQVGRKNNHRYSSLRYLEDVANTVGIPNQKLRKVIRAIRADMVYAEHQNPEARFLSIFHTVVRKYFEDYLDNRGTRSERSSIDDLRDDWDHKTIKNFYNAMYELCGPRAIGTWVPYEMEVVRQYFTDRLAEGSFLSLFDLLVLEGYTRRFGEIDVLSIIGQQTGLYLDGKVIEEYRSILIHGDPRREHEGPLRMPQK